MQVRPRPLFHFVQEWARLIALLVPGYGKPVLCPSTLTMIAHRRRSHHMFLGQHDGCNLMGAAVDSVNIRKSCVALADLKYSRTGLSVSAAAVAFYLCQSSQRFSIREVVIPNTSPGFSCVALIGTLVSVTCSATDQLMQPRLR